MKIFKILLFLFLQSLLLNSCEKDDVDKETPEIDLDIQEAFPTNCDTLYFGETFTFQALFTDNLELGSDKAFSIDIHNNFDHHSHSTEVTECNFDPVKKPVNPFIFIQDYSIPEGLKEYTTDLSIEIPLRNNNELFDEGDYHFFISLTDKEGWSAQKGLSIKILHR